MTLRYVSVTSFCIALASLSCAWSADSSSAGEATARVRQPLAPECVTSTQTIFQAGHGVARRMRSASTHFCWLTMASGNFNGEQPNTWSDTGLGVAVRSDGDWWLVNNDFNDNDGVAQGRCVPLSCFSGDGIDDEVWVSTHNISAIATANGSCDSQTTATAWWGDAATILRWWPGPGSTNGSGENAQVGQSNDPFAPSSIHAADCYHDGVGRHILGRAVSLFVGTPGSGQLATFTGGDFWVQGDFTVDLGVYSDEAICYFTKIFGKFRGAGEQVRLNQIADGSRFMWQARSKQGGSGSGVKGQGKCFWFNQANK
jgi:hypothetical protein